MSSTNKNVLEMPSLNSLIEVTDLRKQQDPPLEPDRSLVDPWCNRIQMNFSSQQDLTIPRINLNWLMR